VKEPVRRAGQPDHQAAAQRQIPAAPDTSEVPAAERPQQEHLRGAPQVMEVVEQQRAVGRLLEDADVAPVRTGEGARLVAEELAALELRIELARRVGGERAPPAARGVDHCCEGGFSRPRLPDQDNRCIRAGVPFDTSEHVGHRGGSGDEAVQQLEQAGRGRHADAPWSVDAVSDLDARLAIGSPPHTGARVEMQGEAIIDAVRAGVSMAQQGRCRDCDAYIPTWQ